MAIRAEIIKDGLYVSEDSTRLALEAISGDTSVKIFLEANEVGNLKRLLDYWERTSGKA